MPSMCGVRPPRPPPRPRKSRRPQRPSRPPPPHPQPPLRRPPPRWKRKKWWKRRSRRRSRQPRSPQRRGLAPPPRQDLARRRPGPPPHRLQILGPRRPCRRPHRQCPKFRACPRRAITRSFPKADPHTGRLRPPESLGRAVNTSISYRLGVAPTWDATEHTMPPSPTERRTPPLVSSGAISGKSGSPSMRTLRRSGSSP